jgi:catechol 2,3-dioxygenase-like lactoylglutathione lyase family enzyme
VYKDGGVKEEDQMKRSALFAAGLGVLVAGTVLQPGAAQGQAGKSSGLRLSLVGIAVSDYPKSQAFYERKMGFPVAFKFSSQDGTRTNTFFQMSRNTFLEMQQATADVRPGLTHAHFVVDDLTATLARLRQAGLPAAPQNGPLANAVTAAGYSQNIYVKNANVYDPNGIRLELNEIVPESLMKKAADSWTAAQDTRGLTLNVVGIGVKDPPQSATFYQRLIGFRVAFTFGPADPQRMNVYYQTSRDTFLEMQPAGGNIPAGMTHFHLLTSDLDAAIARLRQAGLAAAAGNAPGTIGQAVAVSPGARVKNVNVFDPDGIRLELNEYIPESLPKKAVESWQ